MSEVTLQTRQCIALLMDTDSVREQRIAKAVKSLRPDTYCCRFVDTVTKLERLAVGQMPTLLFIASRGQWDSRSGMELAKELSYKNGKLHVIFIDDTPTSAYDVYDIPHVCLLPYDAPMPSIRRAILLAEQSMDAKAEQPIVIHTQSCDRVIEPSEIAFIESNRRVLFMHLPDEVLRFYGKISALQDVLPTRFVQCHKSFLVNLAMVTQLEHDCLTLANGETVPVSQKRRAEIRAQLATWIGRSLP